MLTKRYLTCVWKGDYFTICFFLSVYYFTLTDCFTHRGSQQYTICSIKYVNDFRFSCYACFVMIRVLVIKGFMWYIVRISSVERVLRYQWSRSGKHFDTSQWRHNGRNGVSNHQPHDCLLNGLFRRRSKKTPKLRVTGLCVGNSPVTDEFPAQRASNAENVSIWWRHHEFEYYEPYQNMAKHNKARTVCIFLFIHLSSKSVGAHLKHVLSESNCWHFFNNILLTLTTLSILCVKC